MDVYEFRPVDNGYVLNGGRLDAPLHYPEKDAREYAQRMVGFLSQLNGAEFNVFDSAGVKIETKIYRHSIRPSKSELGSP